VAITGGTADNVVIGGTTAAAGTFTTVTATGAIKAAGNSIIGSSSLTPDGTLHVHTASAGAVIANAVADDLVVENSGDGGITILTPATNTGYLLFGNPTDGSTAGSVSFSGSGNLMGLGTSLSGGALAFYTNTFTERMRISANGNIGIGGTPAEKFDVIAPDNSSIIMARVTRSSKDYGIALENNGGTGHSTINAFGSGAALIFETANTECARITSGGTLAVGTTAGLTSELIHARRSSGTISTLYNSGATGDVLRLYHENTAVTAFSIWGGGAQRGFINSPVSSNGLIFGTSSTERMRITSGGIVGIGAAPISSARLEVFANNTSTHSFFTRR
jgi:hypothetical protein